LIVVSILTLFASNDVSEAIHVTLITLTFLLELLKLEGCSIDILAESETMVRLRLNFTLKAKNFSFSARDLLTKSSNLNLHVIVGSCLIIKDKSGIVTFFLEAVKSYAV
jgi:hypothetical protein